MFHMLLHFVLPLAIALTFFRPRWKFAYLKVNTGEWMHHFPDVL